MPTPVIPETIRVICESGHANEIAVNTWHVRDVSQLPSPLNALRAEEIADEFFLAYGSGAAHAQFGDDLDDDYRMYKVVVQDLREEGGPAFEFQNFLVQGGSSGEPMPTQMSVAITLMTARRGRSYRGRIYLPFFTESANTNGRVNLLVQQRLVAAADELNTRLKAVNSGGVQIGVASKTLLEINDVTAFRVGDVWDVQRRRRSAYSEGYINSDPQ